MASVLNDQKKQQVLAQGRLGWSLRRIQQATGVRRETASIYLKTAGIAVPCGSWGRRSESAKLIPEAGGAQPVTEEMTPETSRSKPAHEGLIDSAAAKPAKKVITEPGLRPRGCCGSPCELGCGGPPQARG